MKKNERRGVRTWIEIDKKAIKNNYDIFRNFIGRDCKMLSVVKSNAYGHNIVEFAQEIEKLGANFFGVDSVVEALKLRKEGIKKPILVLGYTLPEMISEASKENISITISNFDSLEAAIKSREKIKAHIKIDTGMFRHGFFENEVDEVIKILKKSKNITVEGLYTHFSMAKDRHYPTHTKKQIEKFENCMEKFLKVGYKPICHLSATSGALLFKEGHFNMVRVGIGLYGIWPSEETKLFLDDEFALKPILSWKTIVAEIKKVPKDSRVGYDGIGIVKRNTGLAICPIGYWHGFPRALSNTGYVLINGKKAKIVGRVCMDIIMIDITDIKNVKVGDEVVIIGKSKDSEITADEIAILLGGSTYELLTRINPLIKRFYI